MAFEFYPSKEEAERGIAEAASRLDGLPDVPPQFVMYVPHLESLPGKS